MDYKSLKDSLSVLSFFPSYPCVRKHQASLVINQKYYWQRRIDRFVMKWRHLVFWCSIISAPFNTF